MTIKSGYHLTEEDRERINQYIDGIGTDLKAVIKKQIGEVSGRLTRKILFIRKAILNLLSLNYL